MESRCSFFEEKHIVVAAGGIEPRPEAILNEIESADIYLAADGGLRLLQTLGLPCHTALGDFDTLEESEVQEAKDNGVEIVRFPKDKAKSDLQLAIERAKALGARCVTVIGALGGEWDHCAVNLIAPLALCQELEIWGRLLTHDAEIYLISGPTTIQAKDCRVSLVSLSSQCHGLSLEGFLYPLKEASLLRSETLGLANRAVDTTAHLQLEQGDLLMTIMRKLPS